jgi:hypothetical protein
MPTRRVVTGINDSGKSYFVHVGPTPNPLDLGVAINEEVWIDDPAKPDPRARVDPATIPTVRLEPPAGGSVCSRSNPRAPNSFVGLSPVRPRDSTPEA